MVNKFLPDHPGTMGHRRVPNKKTLLAFSLSATFSLHYDAKVILPSFKQVFEFYLNSFMQVEGRETTVLESFVS